MHYKKPMNSKRQVNKLLTKNSIQLAFGKDELHKRLVMTFELTNVLLK